MTEKPKRVLHLTGAMDCGGSEAFIMNLFRNVDRQKVVFDFAVVPDKDFFYSEEIKKLGGNIYTYPFKTKRNILLPFYALSVIKVLLTKGHYEAVHSHYRFLNGIALALAFVCGVKKRFAHSHGEDRPCRNIFIIAFRRLMRLVTKIFATKLLACSRDAGVSLFASGFEVINNGISTEKFAFNPAVRQAKREEMGLSDKFVLMHTGRFVTEKNHKFLLEVFAEVIKIKPNAVLLLAGGGPLEADIKTKIAELRLEDRVRFLGFSRDVPDILKAADAFVFPSVREGLPVAGVEAQAAGLPCFFSDIITKEAAVCNVFFLPLGNPVVWAEEIAQTTENFERRNTCSVLKTAGFDFKDSALIMQHLYTE